MQRNNLLIFSSSKVTELFVPTLTEQSNSTLPSSSSSNEPKRASLSPIAAMSKQLTQSRSLVTIEEEHDRLLKSLIDNRTRFNQSFNTSNS